MYTSKSRFKCIGNFLNNIISFPYKPYEIPVHSAVNSPLHLRHIIGPSTTGL